MRIDLKGIHAAHVNLAGGTEKIYWYAWRGGPRFRGEPGTPDFIASYNEAVAQRAPSPEGRLQLLIDKFPASGEFNTLRTRTRARLYRQISNSSSRSSVISRSRRSQRARHAASSWIGATNWRSGRLGKPITHGRCWRGSCRWRKIAGTSRSIPVKAVAASTTAAASISSGVWRMKGNS